MTSASSPNRTLKGDWKSAFKRVKAQFLITFISFIAICILIRLFCTNPAVIATYYKETFRGPLFAGFMTLGSFLLSFKSFAILRLSEVFKTEGYQLRHLERCKHPGYTAGFLDPLKNLSDTIFMAIVLALGTSAAQLTIGLIPHWGASLFCLWLAVFTATVLVRAVQRLKSNIDIWLEIESERHEDELKKLREKREAEIKASIDRRPD